MASMISEERYKRSVERNIKNLGTNGHKHRNKSIDVLKGIIGIRSNDTNYDSQLREYLRG